MQTVLGFLGTPETMRNVEISAFKKGEQKMQIVADKLGRAVESFFSNEIEQTNKKIKELLSRQDVVTNAETAAMDSLHTLLEYHTWRLSHKTFVYEFHNYRKDLSYPVDPSSSKAFDQFVSTIDEELIIKWFTKYDYLRKMITQSVKNSCSFIEELCGNFSSDAALLLSEGFISEGSALKTVTPLESDPHNGSKVVLCLEFEPAKKILYKPRSLEIDVLIEQIFNGILEFDTLQGISPVAKTVSREGYGWQEFIQHAPISPEETGQAYYNLGLCSAVFSCLGATDLHDENIIFNGVLPYFVDLETSLQPAWSRNSNMLDELMGEMLSDSIARTSIIPAKLITLPHKTLIGAINTPYPQKTNEMAFSLKNPGTDAVDIAKEKITVTRTMVPIMLADNQAPDPLPFQEDFLNGYSIGYEKVMEKREQIHSILSDIQCLIRVITRPTVQYYFMLDACLFPENLIDESSISRVLNYLKPTKLIQDSAIAMDVLEEEIRSIKIGDIPYFSLKANDKCLYSGNFVSDEAFEVSPKNNVKKQLEKLSKSKLLFDKRLIAEGYSDIRIHEAEHENVEDLGYQSPLFSNVLQKVTKDNPDPLIELITSLAIITEADNAEAGWIGGMYGDSPISYESSAFISLHDTGGILFLLEHLTEYEKTTGHSEHMDLFDQSKRGLESLRRAFSLLLETSPTSIISGLNSIDYVFNHDKNRVEEIEQVVSQIQSDQIPRGDVFIGAPGIGLMLASFSDTPKLILENLEQQIHDENSSGLLASDGIAHGNLGIIWTQFRLSSALKDTEKCRHFFEKALEISFPDSVNAAGWCNGNAGLLMVLSEMARALNEPLDLYEIAKKSTVLPENRPVDLSICHGVAGVIQSLLFAYEASGESRYLSLANQYWETALELANTNGFYTGEKNKDYILGYFLGWGGVTDSALLLKMYNNGNSAWFPLNLSSISYQQNIFKERYSALISSN